MGSIMVGVAQLAGKAMVSGNLQKDRQTIEAAINNDIQLIQQTDSQITHQWIADNDNPLNACSNPGQYLADRLTETGGPFESKPTNINQSTQKKLFDRTISSRSISKTNGNKPKLLTQIIYSFQGPENSVNQEQRVIELSPSFQANCYQ